jgi:hypothetical protein
MAHLLRSVDPRPEKDGDLVQAHSCCLLPLEQAVRETLDYLWDDSFRKGARRLLNSLSSGCRVCGFREHLGLLRSMDVILSLSFDEVTALQPAVSEKLEELFALLKEYARTTHPFSES